MSFYTEGQRSFFKNNCTTRKYKKESLINLLPSVVKKLLHNSRAGSRGLGIASFLLLLNYNSDPSRFKYFEQLPYLNSIDLQNSCQPT